MKKIMEWWHSYRLVMHITTGALALLKVSKHNPKLNLASAGRNLEWAFNTYSWVKLGPLDKYVYWRLKRAKKYYESYDFAGKMISDAYTEAFAQWNDVKGEEDGDFPTRPVEVDQAEFRRQQAILNTQASYE